MNGKSPVVEVAQKHIDDSIPENSASCMVAMAIKDRYPGSTKVHVDLQTIRFTDKDGNRRIYLTPGKTQVALVRFDAGDQVTPFTFRLADPIHIRQKARKDTNSGEAQAAGKSKFRVRDANDKGHVTKIGGNAPPTLTALGTATRRKYGIRGLRINQQGQATHMDGYAE